MTKPLRYDIYRNLNKRKGNPDLYVWSIRHADGPNRGRVSGHSENVTLLLPVFKVSESTRQRVIARKRRAVCAFVRGNPTLQRVPPVGVRVRISFNPYASATFYRCDNGAPVTDADAVEFTPGGCFAVNPR